MNVSLKGQTMKKLNQILIGIAMLVCTAMLPHHAIGQCATMDFQLISATSSCSPPILLRLI
jgi:hypothetical protein